MSTHGPEDPSRGQRSEVVFVGPMGAGKSTLAVLLAARLGLPRVAVDSLRGAYYRTLGYDEAYVRRTIGEDFRAVMEYRKPFEARLVEWVVAQHSDCVIDFGAGHVQHSDPELAGRVERALAPFANVVLVLPSSDREESIRVLRERRAPLVFDGFDLDAYAWNLRRPVRRVDGQLGEPPVRRVTAAIALSSL